MSTYTGVTNFQKTVRFFGPPCRLKGYFSRHCDMTQFTLDSTWDDQPLTFTQKNEIIAVWAALSGLRGNVRTPSIARWKARGRLYIRHNWTFFAISYGWDVIGGNCRSRCFSKGVGHFERRFQGERSVAHQPLLVSSSRLIALSCDVKISAVHH